MKIEFDVIVVGAGLVGLTAALACASTGAKVAIMDHKEIQSGNDGRVSALSATSLRLFENLGIDLSAHLQPIHDMLVSEGSPDSPWRLHFESPEETEHDSGLGAIIENPNLKSALIESVEASQNIQMFAPADFFGFQESVDSVSIETSIGTLTSHLLVAADGRNSNLRKKAGITVQRFDYDAASLVTTISHTLPHDGLAWQRIIKGGALAVLPLTNQRSQIVWSGPTKAIQAASALSDNAFLALLSQKMNGYLGELKQITPRQSYPLRLQMADGFSSGRLALVGDAAHIIHPLAGQGLNLGLRDAAALAEGVQSARDTGQDIGVASLLEYGLWRNTDTRALGLLTHVISESSGPKFGPIGHLRRLGLNLTNSAPQLKSALGKRAAGEGAILPKLMQKSP